TVPVRAFPAPKLATWVPIVTVLGARTGIAGAACGRVSVLHLRFATPRVSQLVVRHGGGIAFPCCDTHVVSQSWLLLQSPSQGESGDASMDLVGALGRLLRLRAGF